MMSATFEPVRRCLIVGLLLLLGVFDCLVIIIVGLSLAEFTTATIVYCVGKITIRAFLPLGTEVL
jgi:hypothetical protein